MTVVKSSRPAFGRRIAVSFIAVFVLTAAGLLLIAQGRSGGPAPATRPGGVHAPARTTVVTAPVAREARAGTLSVTGGSAGS
jgi:hypothetical protein